MGTVTDDAMDVTMGFADKGDERSFLLLVGGGNIPARNCKSRGTAKHSVLGLGTGY